MLPTVARILAATAHSADVERCMSANNMHAEDVSAWQFDGIDRKCLLVHTSQLAANRYMEPKTIGIDFETASAEATEQSRTTTIFQACFR